MKLLIPLLFFSSSLSASAVIDTNILTCYDELDRKSTIIEYDLSTPSAVIKESGDEFLCEGGMAEYCTTSEGLLEVSASNLTFTWTRALSGEENIYEINRDDFSYLGEFGGAMWQGRCEKG